MRCSRREYRDLSAVGALATGGIVHPVVGTGATVGHAD
jgi:hypothetical protein